MTNLNQVLIYATALASSIFMSSEQALAQNSLPPNIIMILTDDMAWYDTPVQMDSRMLNSAQEIMRRLEDPNNPGQPYKWNIQQLAEEGMLFRNAYSSAPQCTPTRANLQTGQTTARNRIGAFLSGSARGSEYDGRNRFNKFPLTPNGILLPFPNTTNTIPEILASFNYACAHYGKWHLASEPAVEGYIESDGNTNNNDGETYDPKNTQIPANIADPKKINEITDKTIDFMTTQNAAGKPVYVQLSHYAVHDPWECFPSSRALFQNDPDVVAFNRGRTDVTKLSRKKDPAAFFGMIYDLDQSIGRLVDEIENLGQTDNTYIIFKSDNGYRRFNTQNFSQPYFGAKWFLWQGGLRIPMVIKGPQIPGGSISTVNVTTYDLLPTFFEWAGGNSANLTDVDGISLKDLLEGQAPSQTLIDRSLYFHYPHYRNSNPFSAIVKGNHKLIHSYDGTIRTDLSLSNPNMLFDLSSDPGEVHNINTSPNDNQIAADLWSELDTYLTSVSAWRPQDNSSAYLADNASDYEGDSEYDDRLRYAPFEGSRGSGTSQIDYWFESWGVELGDDSSDYDLDGLSNLLEYALGLDPTTAQFDSEMPEFKLNESSWTYRFKQRYAPGTLQYTVFTTTDFENWTPLDSNFLTISSSGSDFDSVEASFPFEAKRFVKLSVER
ncbi:MAG: sulfatase-like hydrolase/transferase [Verrucomicrobiota bacterium]